MTPFSFFIRFLNSEIGNLVQYFLATFNVNELLYKIIPARNRTVIWMTLYICLIDVMGIQ